MTPNKMLRLKELRKVRNTPEIKGITEITEATNTGVEIEVEIVIVTEVGIEPATEVETDTIIKVHEITKKGRITDGKGQDQEKGDEIIEMIIKLNSKSIQNIGKRRKNTSKF